MTHHEYQLLENILSVFTPASLFGSCDPLDAHGISYSAALKVSHHMPYEVENSRIECVAQFMFISPSWYKTEGV